MRPLEAPEFRSDFHTDSWIYANLRDHLPEFGWAINVGANDGGYADNTYWLEQAGWMVLNVEPIPEQFKILREARKWSCCYACCESDAEDVAFEVTRGDGRSGSSFQAMGNWVERAISVRTRRVDRLLEEHSFPRLDYISIDVEGAEDRVLAGFDIERWKPIVMVIESHSWPRAIPPSYKRIHRSGLDDVFLRIAP